MNIYADADSGIELQPVAEAEIGIAEAAVGVHGEQLPLQAVGLEDHGGDHPPLAEQQAQRRVDAVMLTGAGEGPLMADRFASQTKPFPEVPRLYGITNSSSVQS